VQRVVHLLQAQPARAFKVSELADAVNLSIWHFSHLFLKEIQASPQQFSRRLKLERARILLESSYLRIKEIMAAVGINDKSHFARDFKKAYGFSPIQYRQKYSNNSSDDVSSRLSQQTAKAANTSRLLV
jgi:transcriptional regulator GlxA family with amidase domain